MKLVNLSTTFKNPINPGKRGGGEISNLALFEAVTADMDMVIVSACGSGLWGKSINGVLYYDLSERLSKILPVRASSFFAKLLFFPYALIMMKYLKPNVVLVGPHEVGVGKFISIHMNTRVGAFIRAFENFRSMTSPDDKIKNILKSFVYGDLYAKSINELDFIITNSNYMKQRCLEEFSIEEIFVVYPSIDLELNLREGTPTIRKIGMISSAEKKGFLTFLELAKTFPERTFYILGDAPESHIFLPDNLKILGWQSSPYSYIAEFDVVLVPSKWAEPFGRIAIESLRLGKVVLSSDVGGLREAMNGDSNLLVDPENQDDWTLALSKVLSSPQEYQEMCNDLAQKTDVYSIGTQSMIFKNIILALK